MQNIKEEIWNTYLMNNNILSIEPCYVCHSQSSSICSCAKRRYMNRITDSMIEFYIKEREIQEKEYIKEQIQVKEKELEELKNMIKEYN